MLHRRDRDPTSMCSVKTDPSLPLIFNECMRYHASNRSLDLELILQIASSWLAAISTKARMNITIGIVLVPLIEPSLSGLDLDAIFFDYKSDQLLSRIVRNPPFTILHMTNRYSLHQWPLPLGVTAIGFAAVHTGQLFALTGDGCLRSTYWTVNDAVPITSS